MLTLECMVSIHVKTVSSVMRHLQEKSLEKIKVKVPHHLVVCQLARLIALMVTLVLAQATVIKVRRMVGHEAAVKNRNQGRQILPLEACTEARICEAARVLKSSKKTLQYLVLMLSMNQELVPRDHGRAAAAHK